MFRGPSLELAVPRVDENDRAAGGLDLLPSCRRDTVRVDLELRRDVAVAEELDLRQWLDETLGRERLGRDLPVHRVVLELRDVQRHELDPVPVLESAELGQAHVQRHLAAFEPGREARAATRELAFRALARGLALAGTGPPADTAQVLARALLGHQVVDLHRSVFPSTSSTRCAILRSCPRRAGVSSCET